MKSVDPVLFINGQSALAGGGRTYLVRVLDRLPKDYPAEVVLLVPPDFPSLPHPRVKRVEPPTWALKALTRPLFERFFLPRLIRESGAGVLFCPGGPISTPSFKGVKEVTMFRNMLPFSREETRRYPLGYMRFRLWLLRRILIRSFKRADLIIFISRFGKSVIDRQIPGLRNESAMISHGLSEEFFEKVDDSAASLQPYVLYVSDLQVYKAHLETVRAWKRLKEVRPGPEKLIFVGLGFPSYIKKVRRLIRTLSMEDEIVLTGPVSQDLLPAYYQNATLNLFASSCENCPNILLEALASGRPLLSSNIQPMPEFGGEAAAYFDPYDPEELAALLREILDDPNRMKKMAKASAERAREFSWERSAGDIWAALLRLLDKPNRARKKVNVR